MAVPLWLSGLVVPAGHRSCTYWYLWLLRLADRIEPMHRLLEAGAYRAPKWLSGGTSERR